MTSSRRMAASIALAAAVVATFAIGAHRNMPSRRVKMTRVFPGVSSNAIERGCAAWRESVETCVSGGAAPDAEFTWPER